MQSDLFRQAALEHQKRRLQGDILLQSSISTRVFTVAISVIVAMATVLVVFGHYARIEPAKGMMVPVDGAAKIFALRPGVISRFMVKDGDTVKAGQKLALVNFEAPNATGQFMTSEALDSIRAQRAFANAAIGLQQQRSDSDWDRLSGVIKGLRSQAMTIRDQMTLQREIVSSTSATFDQLDGVVAKGFISKLEYERRRQSALSAQQELSRLGQQLASVQTDIERTTHELSSSRIEGKAQQATSRSALEGLRQQRSKIQGDASYLVEAPVSGRVTAIQTGVGQTVGNGMPMMVIIPDNAKLQADIFVPSRAIGFIRAGQEVRLLYDAFPYQRFGSFKARIDTISRVAIAGAEANSLFKIDEPVYKVTAIPDRLSISAYGKPTSIQAGMTLTANVVIERQTFLEWLLSPLRAVTSRS